MAGGMVLKDRESLVGMFWRTRERTLEMVRTLEKDDFVVQTAPFMSPPKWHVGHVSWIYEAIMSKLDAGYEFYSEEFSEYLNSYYQQFGVPHDKGLRGVVSRPTTEQIFEYFGIISSRVEEFIRTHRMDRGEAGLITMGFHHECQHQELLVYDLQHLLADQYRPARRNPTPKGDGVQFGSVRIPGGIYPMGYGGKRLLLRHRVARAQGVLGGLYNRRPAGHERAVFGVYRRRRVRDVPVLAVRRMGEGKGEQLEGADVLGGCRQPVERQGFWRS